VIAAALAAALVAALAAALAVDAHRARRRPSVPPVARRVLERYDADGRRVDL
jgi:hypothetical protein